MMDNRDTLSLRATFDEQAQLYDQARPGYPPQVFEDILGFSQIAPGGRILEIGCGTGKATLPFAQRGYHILCIELGANLAAVARRNLAPYPGVRVYTGAFEEWAVEPEAFDLAISATAFHWIDPAVRYHKAAQALRTDGTLALFWNQHVYSDAGAEFFAAAQQVYRREAPMLAKEDVEPIPRAEQVPEPVKSEIEATNLFGPVTVRRYPWEESYDSASYIGLLNTYSGHLALDPDTRQRLFEGLAELIDSRFGGRITKGYLTILYLARRK